MPQSPATTALGPGADEKREEFQAGRNGLKSD